MILQQLYADAPAILNEQMPPPMYDLKPVRWLIQLDRHGRMKGAPLPLGGDKENKKGLPHLIPYLGRTSGVRPILLADTPSYVLGVNPEDRRALEKHHAFRDLVQVCVDKTKDPMATAVDAFLKAWDPAGADLPEFGPSDVISFTVDDDWVVDAPAIRSFWAVSARGAQDDQAGLVAECLVTGRLAPIDSSLPGMIKGIPGGQSSGVALISANNDAFESYGLKRAETSPVSREAAERFTKALNALLSSKTTRVYMFNRDLDERRPCLYTGDMVYVFWTSQGPLGEIPSLLDQPDPEVVKALLESYRTGKRQYTRIDSVPYYALALSASGARAVVRDWVRGTVQDAIDNLADWFQAQEIVAYDGGQASYFGSYALAASLYRDARKEMKPDTPRAIMRAALLHERLPQTMLAQAILRCRAEQRVTQKRAALMRAILVRNGKVGETDLVDLDLQYSEPAYVCGRLLSMLERIQYRAQGNINTTLVDRYFGAAATRPKIVLGGLVIQANKAHLPKIRRQRPGSFRALQDDMASILSLLGPEGFPKTLTLNDQAVFALGYYHQRAHDRKRPEEPALNAQGDDSSSVTAGQKDKEEN